MIRHSVYLEGLKTHEVNQVLKVIDRDIIPDIINQVGKIPFGDPRSKRLEKQIEQFQIIIGEGMKTASKQTAESLVNIGAYEAKFQSRVMTELVGVDLASPSLSLIRQAVLQEPFHGAILGDWFDDLSKASQRNLKKSIIAGVAEGEAIPAITRRMQQTLGTTRTQAAMIARTGVTHATTQARETTYGENEDIIKEIMIVATLDTRTSRICMAQDGKVYPINSGPRPPFHPNCRTTTTPVMKSAAELFGVKNIPDSTRASMNGQVPEKTTYPQWLKRQSKSVQEEALGIKNAELFRSGRLDISKVPATTFDFSLSQLRAKELGLTPDDIKIARIFENEEKFLTYVKGREQRKKLELQPRVTKLKAKYLSQKQLQDIENPGFESKVSLKTLPPDRVEYKDTSFSFWVTFDPEHQKQFATSLNLYADRFPESAKKLKSFRPGSNPMALGQWNKTTKEVTMSVVGHGPKKTAAMVQKLNKTGFVVSGVTKGQEATDVALHELGHALDMATGNSKQEKLFRNTLKSYISKNPPTKKDVSTYATYDSEEAFAESFLGLMRNKRTPWLDGAANSIAGRLKKEGLQVPGWLAI